MNNELYSPINSNTIIRKKRTPNRFLLVTMGTVADIGFSNCLHIDVGDSYTRQECDVLDDDLNYWEHLSGLEKQHSEYRTTVLKYMTQFWKLLGWSTPTTCCYQHVLEDKEATIHQFFIMHGLGCCFKLCDYLSHHFYAYTFAHNTLVGIALLNEKVYLGNKKNWYSICMG